MGGIVDLPLIKTVLQFSKFTRTETEFIEPILCNSGWFKNTVVAAKDKTLKVNEAWCSIFEEGFINEF